MSLLARFSRNPAFKQTFKQSIRCFAQSTTQSNKEFIRQNASKYQSNSAPKPGDAMHNNPKNRNLNVTSSSQSMQQAVDQQLAEKAEQERKTKIKNVVLGLMLGAFVVWSYQNSIQTVRHAADAINTTNIDQIEQELDEEQMYKVKKQ